jgi:hypothetical protein
MCPAHPGASQPGRAGHIHAVTRWLDNRSNASNPVKRQQPRLILKINAYFRFTGEL